MSILRFELEMTLPADVFEQARVVSEYGLHQKDFLSKITQEHKTTLKILEHREPKGANGASGEVGKRKRRTKAEMEAARREHLAAGEGAKVF